LHFTATPLLTRRHLEQVRFLQFERRMREKGKET
jgi:hypothetical protein